MGQGIIDVFAKTEQLLSEIISGCSKNTGLPCTAGPDCYCQTNGGVAAAGVMPMNAQSMDTAQEDNPAQQAATANGGGYMSYQQPISDGDGGGGPAPGAPPSPLPTDPMPKQGRSRTSMRMSFGRMSGLAGLGRHMSLTSETTFGRAMSGLSALSIDWENMEDFDVDVDHSEGINNDIIQQQQQEQQQQPQQEKQNQGDQDPAEEYGQQDMPPPADHQRFGRRSSLRKNIPVNPNGAYNVSFNM